MAIDTRKILHTAFDKHTKNVDNYNHNGSTWLIFTDEKKWVIELTKEGTLWYNYYFFQNIMKLLSLEVVENQHYITEWVEDNIISKVKKTRRNGDSMNTEAEDAIEDGVKQTKRSYEGSRKQRTKDTIQNGVKHTEEVRILSDTSVEYIIQNGVTRTAAAQQHYPQVVEDIIQNGVKHTPIKEYQLIIDIEDTIQNGVKETKHNPFEDGLAMEEAIQNGVKYTGDRQGNYNLVVEDTIQNGVKDTHLGGKDRKIGEIKDIIENGVKVTYSDKIPHEYDWSNQFTEEIDDIIQNGVKHTEYGDWLDGDERLDDIIENGVKETTPGGYLGSVEMKGKTVHQFETEKQLHYIEDVIEYGIKKTEGGILFDESKKDRVISDGIKETHDDVMQHTGRVDGVIKNGVKQCMPSHIPLYNPMDFSVQYRENHRLDDVASVLEKGIKEVRPLPSQEGNKDWGDYYYRQGVPTKPHTKYVDDAIRYGVKETWGYEKQPQKRIDEVIMNGQKD